MSYLLRCVNGLLKRCANGAKLLRCGGTTPPGPSVQVQWQTTYQNAGCGTCSNGYYPGEWSSTGTVLATGDGVNEADAGTTVISGSTATSYGTVYDDGDQPATPDTSAPTVAPEQCVCGVRWYVSCARSSSPPFCDVNDCPTQSPIYGQLSDDQFCVEDGGCVDAPDCFHADGNCYPYLTNCYKQILVSGPYCSQAEAIADMDPGYTCP